MTDEVEQDDEIGALQSIYNEEEFNSTVGEDGLRAGSFSAFINLPPGFRVLYESIENGDSNSVVIPIDHLPPILLSFKLPKDYPSQSMPHYTLSCPWLTVKMCKKLCDKLETLWQPGFVVLFTWTNFLKEESLLELSVKDQLELKRRPFRNPKDSERRVGETNQPPRHRHNNNSRRPKERKPRIIDPRIVMPKLEIPLHQFLEAFNDDRTRTTFMREFHECKICFEVSDMDEKPGRDCIQFSPCGHTYCKLCMEQYFRIRIMEGMVTSMPCPSVLTEKCKSEAFPQQVKDVVGSLLFNKYDTLLLNVTLDKMDDITYCPRISCQSAVMRDGDDKMAACPACCYVFCVFCKRAYHGVEFCRMKSVEMQKIVKEYEEGDATIKANLEKRYGRAQIQRFVNDMLSDNWIQTNSKNCPKCEASIEKSDGCNKMACGKCGAFFCWLCLTLLDTNRPYDHFMDLNSRCRNRLFFGLEANPEDDDDDDDDFADYDVLDEADFLGDLSDEDDIEFEDM